MDGNEAYRDVAAMLQLLVDRRLAVVGGDMEELWSLANEGFVQAWRSFDPSKRVKFSTWCWWKVRTALLRAEPPATTKDGRPMHPLDTRDPSWLVDFLDGLSEDGRDLVSLVLDPPGPLVRALRVERSRVGGCIRRHLRGLGWSDRRVRQAFAEMKEALR